MTKVRIERRNYECKDGTAALYASLYIDGKRVRLPVGVSVTADEWDPVRECALGRTERASDINLVVSKVLSRINDILVKCRLTGEPLRKETFLEMFENGGAACYFSTYARARLKRLSEVLRPGTVVRHENVIKKVERYDPQLKLSDITPEWLRIYAAHLRDFHHNVPGTVGKNISTIRTYYYAAMREGLVKGNPFEIYKTPQSDSEIVYLNEDEFRKVIRAYHSATLPDNLQEALGFWLFMAFSGMHISDARSLRIEQITFGEIHYRRIKTGSKVNVPVSKPAAALIATYSGGRRKGVLFEKLVSDQTFNTKIKKVMDAIGIMKNVSAKTARHTFATLYYKKNPGDIGTLAKLLGHADVKTTMIYAHIMKDGRVKGISAFDDFL